jgi:hypothetical protein
MKLCYTHLCYTQKCVYIHATKKINKDEPKTFVLEVEGSVCYWAYECLRLGMNLMDSEASLVSTNLRW